MHKQSRSTGVILSVVLGFVCAQAVAADDLDDLARDVDRPSSTGPTACLVS